LLALGTSRERTSQSGAARDSNQENPKSSMWCDVHVLETEESLRSLPFTLAERLNQVVAEPDSSGFPAGCRPSAFSAPQRALEVAFG
jgi:hypothetical protein